MDKSDTPETDSEARSFQAYEGEMGIINFVRSDFARRLERERNELRARVAELESQLSEYEGGDAYTGVIVEIDGHTYGLRPGAARIVKEALRDAGRGTGIPEGHVVVPRRPTIEMYEAGRDSVLTSQANGDSPMATAADAYDDMLDAAMAKGGE